jgi:uncharacterized protein with NAD-binding domain and iron-sulfur cluster
MRLIQKIPNKIVTNNQGDVGDLPTGSIFVGEITSLPGCPDVGVSHAMYCRSGKGRGNAFSALMMREDQCRDLGYRVMICTVVEGNIAQERTLKKAGYTVTLSFNSPRTGHTVRMWARSLYNE